MNQENTELFFGDEQDVILTLEVEDGTEIKVTPLASFEIEELGTEYVIAAELEDDEETMTGEVQILKYEEDENGEAACHPSRTRRSWSLLQMHAARS